MRKLRLIGRETQRDSRRDRAQPRQKAGITATSIELARPILNVRSAVGGIERLALEHRRLDLGERDAHRIGERKRARRRPHAFGAARQQLVAEQRAEPREIVAHRRLAEPDARRGARNAPLRQQRIERDQQIEVEPA